MEKQLAQNTRTKWKVISLVVKEPFQIINFDLHLAKHVMVCKAIRFSIVESPEGLPEAINQVGILSVSFNRRSRNPLNFGVNFQKNIGHKKESIPLDQSIYVLGTHQGYYLDSGRFKSDTDEFQPYTLKIYLELLIEN